MKRYFCPNLESVLDGQWCTRTIITKLVVSPDTMAVQEYEKRLFQKLPKCFQVACKFRGDVTRIKCLVRERVVHQIEHVLLGFSSNPLRVF